MQTPPYILGLDIGTNSIGWALLKAEERGTQVVPIGVECTGVRIFEAGVSGSIEQGRTESHAKGRRDARMLRRGVFRGSQRLRRAFKLLQNSGLLPGDPQRPSERDRIIKQLDSEIRERWQKKLLAEGMDKDSVKVAVHHNLTYLLRARGLDCKLELYEIGRAFYQLAQRRGFQSSRKNIKAKGDDDKDQNQIEASAKALKARMETAGARTMGEYFARYNPFEAQDERIRGHYTVREMYKEEFEKIWAEQTRHYPDILTPDFKHELLYKLENIVIADKNGKEQIAYACGLFEQRPLKSQDHLVGCCSLEPREKRADWVLLDAQRFRYLQKINDTKIIPPDGGEAFILSPVQRVTLEAVLEREASLTMTKAKELLGLTKNYKFNMGEGGETKFIGNRTAAKFIEVLGDECWCQLTPEQQHGLVIDYLKSKDTPYFMQRSIATLDLDEKLAKKLMTIKLEPGHCNFSRKALAKLLPHLRNGLCLHDAIVEACYKRPEPEPLDLLPPLMDNEKIAYPPLLQAYGTLRRDIRNPVVQRALTELRKVVNAIVRKYGKPAIVRIELARDMKKNDEQRREIWKRNRDQESRRTKAAAELLKECNIANPTRSDIVKVLLWQECGGPLARCPYTDTPISLCDLFGAHPKFDVEHIIPFSISLDDSFLNKTLCEPDFNRRIKQNQLPRQLPGVEEMIARMERWPKSETRDLKIARFKLEDAADLEGFVNSQLNDTRYASRLAMDYVGMLFGGRVDRDGQIRVQVGKGQVTHHIRNVWRLNNILNDGGQKSRDDHRHHAVDAIAIALTEPKTIKKLSDIAARAKKDGKKYFGRESMSSWPGFIDDVRNSINSLTVSHRVSHKVNAGFHQDTIYSRELEYRRDKESDVKKYVHVRRTLGKNLNRSEVDEIVDLTVCEAVKAKISALGFDSNAMSEADWKKISKAFMEPKNLPYLESKSGRRIPIKKVRVRTTGRVMTIGSNGRERNVMSGSNNHLELFQVIANNGNAKWIGRIVTSYEALQRLNSPSRLVVDRITTDKDGTFVNSLTSGDVIELDAEVGGRELVIVKSIEESRVKTFPVNNAGKTHGKRPDGSTFDYRKVIAIDGLRKRNCRKVMVTPVGEIHYIND